MAAVFGSILALKISTGTNTRAIFKRIWIINVLNLKQNSQFTLSAEEFD